MTKEDQINYLKNHDAYEDDSLFYELKMLKSKKTIPIGELVERFIEVDKYFNGQYWNLKQILTNINLIIPLEDREDDPDEDSRYV